MPERLPHRDLGNRSAEILRAVRDGAAFEITDHGEVVAVLSPALDSKSTDLRVRKARHRGGFAAVPRERRATPVLQSLDELRNER